MKRFLSISDLSATDVEELRLAEENVRFSLPAGVRSIPLDGAGSRPSGVGA